MIRFSLGGPAIFDIQALRVGEIASADRVEQGEEDSRVARGFLDKLKDGDTGAQLDDLRRLLPISKIQALVSRKLFIEGIDIDPASIIVEASSLRKDGDRLEDRREDSFSIDIDATHIILHKNVSRLHEHSWRAEDLFERLVSRSPNFRVIVDVRGYKDSPVIPELPTSIFPKLATTFDLDPKFLKNCLTELSFRQEKLFDTPGATVTSTEVKEKTAQQIIEGFLRAIIMSPDRHTTFHMEMKSRVLDLLRKAGLEQSADCFLFDKAKKMIPELYFELEKTVGQVPGSSHLYTIGISIRNHGKKSTDSNYRVVNGRRVPENVQWQNDGFRVRTFYHGTSIPAAEAILADKTVRRTLLECFPQCSCLSGFGASYQRLAGFRLSKGGMLGAGVYMSTDLSKARSYPQRWCPSAKSRVPVPDDERVVLELKVQCQKTIIIERLSHPWQQGWQGEGCFDSAFVPTGVVPSGRTETCVKHPDQILSVEVVAGAHLLPENIPRRVVWDRRSTSSRTGPSTRTFPGTPGRGLYPGSGWYFSCLGSLWRLPCQ